MYAVTREQTSKKTGWGLKNKIFPLSGRLNFDYTFGRRTYRVQTGVQKPD